MSGAQLLKRVFDIDVEHCACGGKLKIITAIEEPSVIARILTHLALPARAPPRSPARPLTLFQAARIAMQQGPTILFGLRSWAALKLRRDDATRGDVAFR